jgi:hypothetical protein
MENQINTFIKFLTENNYPNTLVVFQNELRTDEKPSLREMPRFDPTSFLPDDERDKPSERQIDLNMFAKKEDEEADRDSDASFNNSFGMEMKEDDEPNPFGSFEDISDPKTKQEVNNEAFEEFPGLNTKLEDENGAFGEVSDPNTMQEDNNEAFKEEPFFESKRVIQEEVDNPLSENEPDKFSFCDDNSDPFDASFGNEDNINKEDILVQDSTRDNGFNNEISRTAVNNFHNQTHHSQNPFSEVQQEFEMGFNSIIPQKTHIMVPSFVDNGKLNSYNKILSSRDRVPWTRRAH